MNQPIRPDQPARSNVTPLGPGGTNIAQLEALGLLTDADMIALGLMLNTTGDAINTTTGTVKTSVDTVNTSTQAVNSTLGAPAQDATVATVAGNTGTALTAGVPPGVPNVRSAQAVFIQPGSSPVTMLTFPSQGRLWGVSLSYALASDAGYSGGLAPTYCRVTVGSITLVVVEGALSAASQTMQGNADLPLSGLTIAGGENVVLDVNNGISLGSDTSGRASASILYSIP